MSKKKEIEAAPEKIEVTPRCSAKKNEQCQCSLTEGHKGPHMGNDQDFLISWDD